MKYVYGFFALCLAIFLVDVGLAHFADFRKRRERHIRAKDLARFNMTAFRGAKKFEQ